MIFKRHAEGQPSIKHITTGIPEMNSEQSWIPGISDQEWGSIKNIVAERVQAWPYDDFPEILAPLKMLGLPCRTLNEQQRKKIVSDHFSHLKDIPGDDMQLIFKDVYRIILHDRTILDALDFKAKEQLLHGETAVRNAIHKRSTDPNVYAWMKVVNPRQWVRPEPEQLLSMGMIQRPSRDASTPLYARIASMAALRVIDDLYDPEFKSEDWHAVRNCIQDFIRRITSDESGEAHINVVRLIRLLFHLRILNAKEVRVDEQGLHVTDRNTEPVETQLDTPIPLRRNL